MLLWQISHSFIQCGMMLNCIHCISLPHIKYESYMLSWTETSNDRTMEHENGVLKKSSNWVETVYDVLSYAISFTLTFQIVHIVWLNDDSVRGFVLYHMKMLRTWKYVLFIQYTHSTYYLHIGTQIKLKTMAFIS